jgi:hypothetical protein
MPAPCRPGPLRRGTGGGDEHRTTSLATPMPCRGGSRSRAVILAGIVAASQWCSHACSQATGNFLEDGQILFLYRACPILKAANVIYLFIPHILEHLTSES